jgi:hypothetical protein
MLHHGIFVFGAPVSLTPENQMVGCQGSGLVGTDAVGAGVIREVVALSRRSTRMNVLSLMVLIILAYWIVGMTWVSKRKDWD